MQQGHSKSSDSVQGTVSVEGKLKTSGPQVLDLALLDQIAGGGPHGGWAAAGTDGPHGGWASSAEAGPHGGW